MQKPYIIAADIGTTSAKTLLFDKSGRILASHAVEYPLHTPRPEIAEQDPEQIFQAVLAGIQAVVRQGAVRASEVLCVSFSSAMHSLIAVDEACRPLTACITWADNRSVGYVKSLKERDTGHAIYMRTGTPIHPMSPLLKLMWFRDERPDLFASAHKFIGIKEYVFARLFGQYVIDHSLASCTGLFNLRQLDWDVGALAACGVRREQLSQPVPTTHIVQGLQPADAAQLGIAADTPFVVGASDGVLANLGAAAFEPGVYAVTIGTSGAVRGVVREPITDPKGRLFCYALKEDFWVVGGAINNGGIMFRWVRDQLATAEAEEGRRLGMDPYDYLSRLASEVAPGSGGLVFLPLLAGERAPYWNANARGVFFGLSLYHQKPHMIRAVLEGVMYRIHSVVGALEELSGPTREIRASGGFARSQVWLQMMADVLGSPVTVPNTIEASGAGAALLGRLATGEIADFSGAHEWVQVHHRLQADAEAGEVYRQLTQIYGRVYHQLKDEFDAIAAFQQKYTLT
ncbi:gluconokinase [Paenibacillus sp. UNCCL117]|uniref:gluconokinase n=1 Tax=unclassified Paenibacillus TaxID=185978 RepID=UPI000887C17D|nr:MULTISPECIES: FGGY family carbohydrate kinase [unclassified Paenibacillus]SDC79066.1 gluconate kinase, FGGY family [Paenibacillus sp. cl123]SFW26210.1 gluconokinase [Paenibacillus sp. UNCCL117]